MKRWQKILLSIGFVIAGAVYWLFYDNRPGADVAPLDMAALRAAADSLPGEKPLSVSVERAAAGDLPAAALAAGAGFGASNQGVHAFSVNFGQAPVLIDTGFDKVSAEAMPFYTSDPAAQARIEARLVQARAIVVTHEHMDHIAGLLSHPQWKDILGRALITQEQFDHPEITAPVAWPKGSRETFKPHVYSGLKAIAPGVVVMKAPSHTPGSQIVFVKRADGREYLFMGDISSMDRNWRETRARSRLIGDVIVGEDREAVFAWLKAFKAAADANPALVMVPTHDATAVDRLINEGRLLRGFKAASPN